MKKENKRIYGAALIYAFVIGHSSLFVKVALQWEDPLTVLAHRFTLSALVLGLLVASGRVRLKIKKEDVVKILPLALVYPILFFGLQTMGLVTVSSAEAGIVQAFTPMFTMILAELFLKEKATVRQNLFLSLSVAGAVYIFISKGISVESTNAAGIGLIVLSALSSACYNVLARKRTREYRGIDLTAIMIFSGFIVFNGISIGDRILRGTVAGYFTAFREPAFVCAIGYLGILSTLGTAYLSTRILAHLEAFKMSVFGNLSTLIAIVAGMVFLKESLETYHLIGSIAIAVGVLGTNSKFAGKK